MSAVVPLGFRVPTAEEMRVGRPVVGRTLGAIAGALNHINGLHCRGFAPIGCYQLARLTGSPLEDIGYVVDEALNETHRIPYYVPPGVALLHVAAIVLSYETGGEATPSLTIDILSGAGASIDEGCAWDRATGTMPGSERGQYSFYELLPALIESAAAFRSTDPTSGPTGPRRLSVAGKDGDVVILRVVTVRAMMVALYILPLPPVTL